MPETGYSNGINGKLGSGSLFSQTNAGKHTHLGAPIVVGTQPHSTKTQAGSKCHAALRECLWNAMREQRDTSWSSPGCVVAAGNKRTKPSQGLLMRQQ